MTTTTVLRADGCAYVVRTVLAQQRRVDAHLDLREHGDLRQDSLRATYAEVAQSAVPGFRIEHAPADNVQARMLRRASARTAVTTVDGGTQELGNQTVWLTDADGTRVEGWTCLYGRSIRRAMAQRSQENGRKGGRKPTCQCQTCAKCLARKRQAERRARLRQEKMDRNADLANARASKGPNAAVAVSASGWDQDN